MQCCAFGIGKAGQDKDKGARGKDRDPSYRISGRV